MMLRDDTIQLAQYDCDQYLLDNPVYKQLCCYVKKTKKMNRLLKNAKYKQLLNAVNIKLGMNIPCKHNDEIMFDAENGNTNWKDAEFFEINQIYNFDPFDSLISSTSARIPPGHTKIQVHLIYYYTQYGSYKALMVASVNMTGPNLDTYYSSFIPPHSKKTVVLLDVLNVIKIRTDDISNAYLTARTS